MRLPPPLHPLSLPLPTHPTCYPLQIYQTGLESMAVPPAQAQQAASAVPLTDTTLTTGPTQDSAAELASAAADPASEAQPAADCVTACDAYNGAFVCFTAENLIRACTTGAAGGAATNASSGGGASAAGAMQTAAASDPQPAADCVTPCGQQGGSSDMWVCYTASQQPRECLTTGPATSASLSPQSAAIEAALAPPAAAAAAAPATNASGAAAAQLGGQLLCSPTPIQGECCVAVAARPDPAH